MNKKLVSTLILCMLCISSMLIIFQDSPLTLFNRNNDTSDEILPIDEGISANEIADYFTLDNDVHTPRDLADFSQLYYKYKDSSLNQANETLEFLISNLWDPINKGFNDSDALTAKKSTFDNMLMLSTFLNFYSIEPKQTYLTYAEDIFNFAYKYLWDNDTQAFLSYCEYDGSNPSPQLNSTDNALAIIALLKLYEITTNQTYLDIALSIYGGLNSILYDSTNGGYFRSNLSSDVKKFAADNFQVISALAELARNDAISPIIQDEALAKAEDTLNLLITTLLNGTYGFFPSADSNWTNPIEQKEALDNAKAIETLLTVYDLSLNQSYLEIAVQTANFVHYAFLDSTVPYQGYNTTTNWQGNVTLNSMKYLEINSQLMKAGLILFETTFNSSHYIIGINISKFLDIHLLDSSAKAFNFSVGNPLKSTAANALAIQGLLYFRYPRPYLTRANSVMNLINHYMYQSDAYNDIIMYDWSSLASQVLYSYPSTITLAQIFKTKQPTKDNLIAIYTLLQLAAETQQDSYITIANETLYFLKDTVFLHAFTDNASINQESGQLVFSTETNAWGILTLLKLYEHTGDSLLLEMINDTWYYIKDNLYDYISFGYNMSNLEQSTKELIPNCLMIWANLEIIESNYSIFDNILHNTSNFINQTVESINQNMWDNTNYGYFTNASANWNPLTTGNTVKSTKTNSITTQILLKYLNLYQNSPNTTLLSDRINQTVGFMLENLWDSEFGGFYYSCNSNGSLPNTDKYTITNSWAILAFLDLYLATNNFSYYLIAEEISNFLNTYLWDYEYAGFHHFGSREGVPSVLGLLDTETGKILLSFKFLESQINPILALTRLSDIKNPLPSPIVVDLELNPPQLDRGSLNLQVTMRLIDIEGQPINQSNIIISMSGLYKTIAGERLFGLASKTSLIPQNSHFSGNLDISLFFADFHLTLSAINSSMAVTWLSTSKIRTFDVYLSRALSLLNTINTFFWDDENGGYIPSLIEGKSHTKNTFDNFLAILAILEYYNASGLNLFFNYTTGDLDQILFTYIEDTFNFLYDNLSYTSPTDNAIAFFSSSNLDGSLVSSEILCKDTALAVIALLEYYAITTNTIYLEVANKTWNFLNSTFWDSDNFGYIHSNGSSAIQSKYTLDNIWAILANIAIYNSPQINQTIRQSALHMANLTISLLREHIWDSVYLGYYSIFNGSTWIPLNTSDLCKITEINSLAIHMLLQYADLFNTSTRDTYITYAMQTYNFIDSTLRDNAFLGYFSATNNNATAFNTNKTLADNSMMILALLDLYHVTNLNYTYYQLAEEALFFISRYYINPYFKIYHKIASKYGAINYNFLQLVPIDANSNFNLLRSLSQADLERQNLAYPLVIENINVEMPKLGEIQTHVNMTLEVYDSEGNPIENGTVLGIIFGQYQVFTFQYLGNNFYSGLLNLSSLAEEMEITLLVFKQGYSVGVKDYTISRIFPIYIQKSYETIISLLLNMLSGTEQIFFNNAYDKLFSTYDNFLAIQALLDFIDFGENILWYFDWYSNRTFLSYSEIVANSITKILNSSSIQVGPQNVSGFIPLNEPEAPTNYTECGSNAQAILTFLNLYNQTNNPNYLELANTTWLYLNATFWDSENYGYYTDSARSDQKTLYDNCLAILANLAIKNTPAINAEIRGQASTKANQTFVKMNQSFWDNVHGTYYTLSDANWSYPTDRVTLPNALMILTLIELFKDNPNNTAYLNNAEITANLLIEHFYDYYNGGFYQGLSIDFSQPIFPPSTDKYTEDNAWAILALISVYEITGNTSLYYHAEDTMNFVNSYLANHYNAYLNSEIDDINGYWDYSQINGYVSAKPRDKYIGSLSPSALIVSAMLKLFAAANSTLSLINASVQILPAATIYLGEYCNISIAVFDENGQLIGDVFGEPLAKLNITLSGWNRYTEYSGQEFVKVINYEYNPLTKKYHLKDINLTGLEDIYFTVYVKTSTYATWWNVYYLHRTETGFSILRGIGGDYLSSEGYWQYTIGEDTIIIEALYTDFSTFKGISNAALNFTVYFPNGTFWFSQSIATNSSGWARLVFGPIPDLADFFGQYNITIFASHVNTSLIPITWYASVSDLIIINIDVGISIPYFYPLESFAAQGDILQCNVTVRHRKIAPLMVNIEIYSEGVLIPTTVTKNLTTGFNIFLIDVQIDERTPIGFKYIYVNITLQGEYVRSTYFFLTVLSAAVIRNYYVPTWIAADDLRYATIELEHRKQFEASNISVKINCPALETNPTIQLLQPLAWQEYYFPLILKNNIPYGIYSGEIIVERVNYTLKYNDANLTFQIEVKPPTQVVDIRLPSNLAQNQRSILVIELHNYRTSTTTIRIVGHGTGFNSIDEFITLDPGQTETFNLPLIYYTSPWDVGQRDYNIEIYYLNQSSQFALISSNNYQILVNYSLTNVLIGFILPATILAIAVFYIFWYRDKKKRERKKLK